jgi:hypothetical protein
MCFFSLLVRTCSADPSLNEFSFYIYKSQSKYGKTALYVMIDGTSSAAPQYIALTTSKRQGGKHDSDYQINIGQLRVYNQ